MAYGRKKTYTKKRPIGKSTKAPTVDQLAMDVRKLNAKLGYMAKPETEFYETTVTTPATVAYNANIFNYALISPAQGIGEGQRKSDQISAKLLQVKLQVFAGLADRTQCFKVLLLQSRARFVPSMVTSSGTQSVWDTAGTNDVLNSFHNWENRGHYRILAQKTFKLDPIANDSGPNVKCFTLSYRFKKFNRVVKFDPAGITTQKNQVYLLMVSDLGNDANAPSATYTSRVTYCDN